MKKITNQKTINTIAVLIAFFALAISLMVICSFITPFVNYVVWGIL